MGRVRFEWDDDKDIENELKHGVSFAVAQRAFLDHTRIIMRDVRHSQREPRYYCLGRVGGGILTVRFTYRRNVIRIIGAGYWRKGKRVYEEENKIRR